MAHEFADDKRGRSARHRKTEALRSNDHRGIDTNDLSIGRHEWAARTPGVERRVGLNDVIHQSPAGRAQRSSERRHNTGCYSGFEPERVADSDDKLAPPQSFRVAKRRCWSAG